MLCCTALGKNEVIFSVSGALPCCITGARVSALEMRDWKYEWKCLSSDLSPPFSCTLPSPFLPFFSVFYQLPLFFCLINFNLLSSFPTLPFSSIFQQWDWWLPFFPLSFSLSVSLIHLLSTCFISVPLSHLISTGNTPSSWGHHSVHACACVCDDHTLMEGMCLGRGDEFSHLIPFLHLGPALRLCRQKIRWKCNHNQLRAQTRMDTHTPTRTQDMHKHTL